VKTVHIEAKENRLTDSVDFANIWLDKRSWFDFSTGRPLYTIYVHFMTDFKEWNLSVNN
jgi:hypothetical protein